jgi:hypothetical protein
MFMRLRMLERMSETAVEPSAKLLQLLVHSAQLGSCVKPEPHGEMRIDLALSFTLLASKNRIENPSR